MLAGAKDLRIVLKHCSGKVHGTLDAQTHSHDQFYAIETYNVSQLARSTRDTPTNRDVAPNENNRNRSARNRKVSRDFCADDDDDLPSHLDRLSFGVQ